MKKTKRKNYYFFFIVVLIPTLFFFVKMSLAARTIIDTERGSLMTNPYNNEWSKIGSYVSAGIGFDTGMTNEAIKVTHGRFQHFSLSDDGTFARFPYNELQAYEKDEVAAGRNPFFLTATYDGKKRPLLQSYGNVVGATPNVPLEQIEQLVNFGDDRFVKFWINNYVRKIEHSFLDAKGLQNLWEGSDNCNFDNFQYYVLDDNNKFVSTMGLHHEILVPWDPPAPQNQDEFNQAVNYFNQRVKELAPDTKLMWNASVGNAQFPKVASGVDGIMMETLLDDVSAGTMGNWDRNAFYSAFKDLQWFGSLNKTAVVRDNIPAETNPAFSYSLRTNYIAYLLVRGDNFLFDPVLGTSEIDPAKYAEMKNALGRPTAPAESQMAANVREDLYPGTRQYSRKTEGGIVYLNLTKSSETVTLPTDKQYYDHNGNPVTQITIPDVRGDYVLTTPGKRVARPQFSPNGGVFSGGPISVSLSSTTSGAEIHFTLDGSDPTISSLKYTGPISISSTATIKAKAFLAGYDESFSAESSFTINSQNPSVEFHLTSESSSEFISTAYPLLKLSSQSTKPITVNYAVTSGTATNGKDYNLSSGMITFNPGDTYKYFPIEITNDQEPEGSETIQLSISNPTNVSLGNNKTYTYTIEDNDNKSISYGYLKLPASADSEIRSDFPTFNHGTEEYTSLYVNSVTRSLIKFDLSSIPSNAKIISAGLGLSTYGVDKSGDGKVPTSAYRLLKDWKENEVTWNKADSSTAWTAPGVSGVDSDRASAPTSVNDAINYGIKWDVTSDVQDMMAGKIPNYGWLFVANDAASGDWFNFYSKEKDSADIYKPSLEITYSIPTAPRGDLNSDNLVNQLDFDILKTDFLKLTANLTNPKSDIDGDGEVSIKDVGILMSGWK